jgi:hypothetical protein
VDLRGLLIGTAVLAAGVIGPSLRAFQVFSTANAEFTVVLLVAFALAAWGALFALYLRDYRNAGVVSGMGTPPLPDRMPSPPGPPRAGGSGKAAGSGTSRATASALSVPPPNEARDDLRVERFLRDASFPNEWSRRNAHTWLLVFQLQHPYLSAKLPPESADSLVKLRTEVAAEPMSQLRNEVRDYFSRNEMAWVEVSIPTPSQPVVETKEPSPTGSEREVPAARVPGIGSTASGTDSQSRSANLPTPESVSKRPVTPAEKVLFDGWLSVGATGHAEVHYDLSKGTRLRGLAREGSAQPFDLYIMNRRNYVRFVRDHESHDLLAKQGDAVYDYKATIPKDDTWFVVVDTYGKVNNRAVLLELRATVPERK